VLFMIDGNTFPAAYLIWVKSKNMFVIR
jgi:hypothetical protein